MMRPLPGIRLLRSGGTDPASARRAGERLAAHLRRAARAVRNAGPGRCPGWISGVDVDDGTVAVHGEAHIPGERFELVLVRWGGTVLGAAPVDQPTPRLVELRPGDPTAATGGWRLVLPRAAFPTGDVWLDALGITASGLVEPLEPVLVHVEVPRSAEIEAEQRRVGITGLLDEPSTPRLAGQTLVVRGWAAPAAAVDRVEVHLDDGTVLRARPFTHRRDDIAEHLADPTAVLAGFELHHHLGDHAGRPVRLRVEAVGAGGRVTIGERRVDVPPDPPVADDDARWLRALAARTAGLAELVVPSGALDVVVVTHELGLGGAQLWLQQILHRLLAEPDVACTVLSQRDGPLRAELERRGARVGIIGPLPTTGGRYESAVADLVRLLATESPSVVLANTMGAFIGVDAARRAGLPGVLAVHEHYRLDDFWTAGFGVDVVDAHVRRCAEDVLADAAAVAFVSDATRRLYAPHLRDNGIVVDYGVDAGEVAARRSDLDRAALRAAHGIGPDEHLLVEVATVEPRKAQANLVLAAARLRDRHPHVRLALVGDDGRDYGRGVRRLADALGIGAAVRLVPLTDDVAPWLVMADGFVLGSDVESLPRSVIEAMLFEVPVVATRVGGTAELVEDGLTGITCEPRDVGALAEAVERLLVLPADERRAMVAAAADRVRARPDAAAYVGTYVRLLRSLAKDPSGGVAAALGDR